MNEPKMLGTCPVCRSYGALTQQHVRIIHELSGYRVTLCRKCHDTITQYEEEILRALEHIGRGN